MNIGICDDDAQERASLRRLLLADTSSFVIFEYASGEDLLDDLGQDRLLDLLFLDIYMGGRNGMETAKTIRQSHKTLPIVFLTSTPAFALPAFGVRAAGYMLKPVDEEELMGYLDEYRQSPVVDVWQVTTEQGDVCIPIQQMVYCEQKGHYGEVCLSNGTRYRLRTTFADMVQQLEQYEGVVPCGRSYLLNLSFVYTLQRQSVVLHGDITLTVPRRAYGALRTAYLDFYGGKNALENHV